MIGMTIRPRNIGDSPSASVDLSTAWTRISDSTATPTVATPGSAPPCPRSSPGRPAGCGSPPNRRRWVLSVNSSEQAVGREQNDRPPPPTCAARTSRRSGCPDAARGTAPGNTRPTTASASIPELIAGVGAVEPELGRPTPPAISARPRISSRLPRMLPVIEALTSSTRPARSATIAMISSAALPKVALSRPPIVGPVRWARCSVASPM